MSTPQHSRGRKQTQQRGRADTQTDRRKRKPFRTAAAVTGNAQQRDPRQHGPPGRRMEPAGERWQSVKAIRQGTPAAPPGGGRSRSGRRYYRRGGRPAGRGRPGIFTDRETFSRPISLRNALFGPEGYSQTAAPETARPWGVCFRKTHTFPAAFLTAAGATVPALPAGAGPPRTPTRAGGTYTIFPGTLWTPAGTNGTSIISAGVLSRPGRQTVHP